MNPMDTWKDSVRERMVPPEFAEQVMAAVAPSPSWMQRLWARPTIRVATWVAASIALAIRVAAAFAFFLLG